MKAEKQKINSYILYDTPVENLFISEYMPKAPEHCVKAYLLALMHANLAQPIDSESMARELGISISALADCWDYWEAQGIVIKHERNDGEGCDIELVNLREMAFGMAQAPVKARKVNITDEKALSRLYTRIENCCGRLLDAAELEAIATLVSEYEMDPDFILAGYTYCTEKRKSTKSSYVSSILKDWSAKGLKTEGDVKEYLSQMDLHYDLYRKVFRALGFTGRTPGEEEKRRMNSWTDDMGFSLEKIIEACNKTSGISNPNINYVDTILKKWYEESKAPKTVSAAGDIIALVIQSYEDDRNENKRKSEEIRSRIYTQIPRISAIMDELKDSSYKLSKALFMGPNGQAAVNRERLRQSTLNEERIGLLAAAGFGPDALDPIYTCSKCKDTGEDENGGRCSCFNEKIKLMQLKQNRQ